MTLTPLAYRLALLVLFTPLFVGCKSTNVETPRDAGFTKDADSQVVGGGSQTDAGGPTTKVTYDVDRTTNFSNPERGFYHHLETQSTGYSALSATSLSKFRTDEAISLVLRIWYLKDYVDRDFDTNFLDQVEADFIAIRNAGLKAVVRFAYSDLKEAPYNASKDQILSHLAQIGPILAAHSDIIATVQVGFIGVWGEWYYTNDDFGNQGTISTAQWTARQEVVTTLLAALPTTRTVQLRTPLHKKTIFGADPISSTEAFSGTDRARVGHHNDCFLADRYDYGTYQDVVADKAYLARENRYLPQGGETCVVSSYSGWRNASNDMAALHWSFLNIDYLDEVYQSWGANLDVAKRKLGYRFSLEEGNYSRAIPSGGDLALSFTIHNDGWAAPFNPRAVKLVLRSTTSGSTYAFALDCDPRRWTPGVSTTISQTVRLTGVPSGRYELLLSLPDPEASITTRPEYAIRLANVGTWESSTGYNRLNHLLEVQ